MNKDYKWNIYASKLICISLILLITYIFLKYAIMVISPFVFAWAIGATVSFCAKKSAIKFKGREKFWRIFYIALFWGVIFSVILGIAIRMGIQAAEIFSGLSDGRIMLGEDIQKVLDMIISIPARIPFLKNISNTVGITGEYVKNAASSILDSFAEQGGSFVAKNLGRLALNTPKAVISILVCIISSVYLSVDYEKIGNYLKTSIFGNLSDGTKRILSRISKGFKQYLKAYAFVFVITFVELYLGLLVLGRKYALFIAFLVAALDILPIFGVGIVLIPWSIVLIAGGNVGVGIGMLVLFVIITVVRQIAEPHIVGSHLGIHPFASLFAVYIGFRFLGFWGMVTAPLISLAIKEIFNSGEKNKKIEEKT